jgi:hypothetical protein
MGLFEVTDRTWINSIKIRTGAWHLTLISELDRNICDRVDYKLETIEWRIAGSRGGHIMLDTIFKH